MSHQREEADHLIDQLFTPAPEIVGLAGLWALLGEGLEWFWEVEFKTKLAVATSVYVAGVLVGILVAMWM